MLDTIHHADDAVSLARWQRPSASHAADVGLWIGWTVLFSAAAVGFALAAHRDAWQLCRWVCLAVAGLSLCVSWSTLTDPVRMTIGKHRLTHPAARVVLVGVLGVLAGMGYRRLLVLPVLPSSVHLFALLAMAVGATEEIIWRGWLQGLLSQTFRARWAVVLAALSHTAYKAALFAFPPLDMPGPTVGALALLVCCTFTFGALLGVFRMRQGSVCAPVVFHAIFDLVVYGGYATVPWWVM